MESSYFVQLQIVKGSIILRYFPVQKQSLTPMLDEHDLLYFILKKISLSGHFQVLCCVSNQQLSGSALKTGKREVPGFFPRSRLSTQPMGFSETRVNTGQDPLKRPPRKVLSHRPRSHMQTIGLNPITQSVRNHALQLRS